MSRAQRSTGSPFLAAVKLLVLASLAAFALPVVAAPRAWTETRSAHFRVASTDAAAAHRLAADLETFRAVLERRGHNVHLELDAPILVVLADGRDLGDAAAALDAPTPAAGFALASDRAPVLLVDRSDENDEPRTIAYRGYIHLVLDRTPATPAWFREGLAEYYRTFALDEGRVLLGRAAAPHIAQLRYFPLLPFETLLTLDRAAIENLPARERATFASQSWALVHSRFSAGYDGKRQLSRVMGLMEAGVAPEDAVRDAFSSDFEGLARGLRQYARQRRHTYVSVAYDDLAEPQVGPPLPIARDELMGELALARDGGRELASIVSGPAPPTPAEYPATLDSTL